MEKRRLLIVILALVVINIISITMKNYTVAIVFSSLCIAYVLLSMLTSTVMNRRQRARTNPLGDAAAKLHPNPGDTSRIEPRYRAPNVTPDDQDAQPSMAAVDTSLFSTIQGTECNSRLSRYPTNNETNSTFHYLESKTNQF